MEKQIDRLKRNLQRAQAQGYMVEDEEDIESPITNGMYANPAKNQVYMNNDEAVSSLLHLKQSGSFHLPRITHQLEDVGLTQEGVQRLFQDFFDYYHQFLPFLNPQQAPDQYFTQSPLLFWAIISVAARRTKVVDNLVTSLSGPLSRLLWTTVGGVPNNHHVVKALCLLCTWPLPTSTTSTDPTHILGGVMMKCATNLGLHRPSHAQDFSRTPVALNQDELHDRVRTWATCNIVSQTLGTGYGQPASTLYDWTLALRSDSGAANPFALTPELDARLQIEKFCDKISKECYSNQTDPIGLSGDEIRNHLTRVFKREHSDQAHLAHKPDVSPLIDMWHKAAGIHLRLAAFFDSSATPGYMDDLTGLWRSTVSFLDCVFNLEDATQFLQYGTNYMNQMIVAAGFVLLKLLGSFFAADIPFERGRQLFHRTIQAVRSMSVVNNDLSWRLAELMAQMWNGMRIENRMPIGGNGQIDNSLQLKVRCRHSMSLVFDSVWRWREEYQALGRGDLEGNSFPCVLFSFISRGLKTDHPPFTAAIKNPTNPDSAHDSRASSTALDGTLLPPSHAMNSAMGGMSSLSGITTPGISSAFPDSNYEVFDPLNWCVI